MDLLIFVVLFALPATAGWYITRLLCLSIRVRWYWAVVGTAGAGLLTAAFVWLGLSHLAMGTSARARGLGMLHSSCL